MKADVSRITFDPAKHYAAVVAQQGRVQLDADWNERDAIVAHLARTTATDVVGRTGVPREGGGFAVSAAGGDLDLSPGRLYVDGLLVESTPAAVPFAATSSTRGTVATLTLDGRPLAAGQRVEVLLTGAAPAVAVIAEVGASSATLRFAAPVPGLAAGVTGLVRRRTSLLAQPDLDGALPGGAGRYVVYLDVWERLVTTLDDPHLAEPALGQAADTTARLQVVWQARLAQVGAVGNGGCDSPWRPPEPTGTLAVRLDPVSADEGPCVLPPAAGYTGLEHQLYRVEVRDATTFLWQRDNASIVTLLEDLGTDVRVADVGRDENLGFHVGDLVEATDDAIELAGQPGDLCTIVAIDRATRVLTLDHAPAVDADRTPKLRRWDGRGTIGTGAWVGLEDGVQVRFGGGTYRTGDHWLIPARAATAADTGDVEWPRGDDGTPLSLLPHGVRHHYAPLAVVDFDGAAFALAGDCRETFPPLTAITAADVSYAEGDCALDGATTVQEAIDALCRREGKCTIQVQPGPRWYRPLLDLEPGQDAEICFPVGEFAVDRTVTLTGLGHLLVTGAGPGTRLVVRKQESVLAFEGCDSVTVRDLTASGGVATDARDAKHLNGALSFRGCRDVVVDSVTASCAAREARAATCVTVGGSPDGDVRSVRVTRSRLLVGQFQTGLLVWDAARVTVTDNEVEVRPLGRRDLLPFDRNLVMREAVRRMMRPRDVAVKERSPERAEKAPSSPMRASKSEATHEVPMEDGRTMTFRSSRETAPAWQSMLHESGRTYASEEEARADMDRMAAKYARGEAPPGSERAKYLASLQRRTPPVAMQGIVVGGRVARDVRIADNTVTGFVQGIHVGVSDRTSGLAKPLSAGRLSIARNTVGVVLPPFAVRARHGVFVGNCESLLVEDNRIAASVPDKRPIDGIRVHGVLGGMAIVRANHLSGFVTGIAFVPLGEPGNRRYQWVVEDNMAEFASNVVTVADEFQSYVRVSENRA